MRARRLDRDIFIESNYVTYVANPAVSAEEDSNDDELAAEADFDDRFGCRAVERDSGDDALGFARLGVALTFNDFACEDDVFEVKDVEVVIFSSLAICTGCSATTWNRLMLNQPFFEGSVHAGLPTWSVSAECRQHLGIEPNRNLLLRRMPVFPSGIAQRTNRCRNATAQRDNARLPVDSVRRRGRRRCSLRGGNLLWTKDFQSSLGFAIGLHSGTRSSEQRLAARSTPKR